MKTEMDDLFTQAGFSDISVKWCSFAHIDMIDPLFLLAQKIEPFVEKRVSPAGLQYLCKWEKT